MDNKTKYKQCAQTTEHKPRHKPSQNHGRNGSQNEVQKCAQTTGHKPQHKQPQNHSHKIGGQIE